MRVEPTGPVPCDLALFGEAPGYEEQQRGEPFVGKAGQQLWSDMRRFVGLGRADFYVSNIVKEGLPKSRDPKPEEIAQAMPGFLTELEDVYPKVVVAAGGFATRALLGDVKMSDVHGIPHEVEICGRTFIALPIYHPAAGLDNKGFLSAFAYDLKCLKRLLDDDLKPWTPGPPTTSSWLARAGKRLPAITERPHPVVALDTEGWATQPWGLSFSCDGERGYVIRADDHDLIKWFIKWITGSTLVLHNGLHDVPVLRRMGILITAFHDTQVLAYHDMLATGSGVLEAESQNLGTLAYRECSLRLGELTDIPGVDFDTQTIPYSDAVMQYAGADPCATWRLFKTYEARGITTQRPYQIDIGQVGLVESMIANGLPFDADAAVNYYADVLDKLEAVSIDLKTQAARFGLRDFNPGSHPQVRELLTRKIGLRIRKRTKGGLASTSEKALADHTDNPIVGRIQTHRELVKLRGTYLGPLLEEIVT